jgi:hypothetical protein
VVARRDLAPDMLLPADRPELVKGGPAHNRGLVDPLCATMSVIDSLIGVSGVMRGGKGAVSRAMSTPETP